MGDAQTGEAWGRGGGWESNQVCKHSMKNKHIFRENPLKKIGIEQKVSPLNF